MGYADLNEDEENESIGLADIYLYIWECDTSCKSCAGPDYIDCTACNAPAVLINSP